VAGVRKQGQGIREVAARRFHGHEAESNDKRDKEPAAAAGLMMMVVPVAVIIMALILIMLVVHGNFLLALV